MLHIFWVGLRIIKTRLRENVLTGELRLKRSAGLHLIESGIHIVEAGLRIIKTRLRGNALTEVGAVILRKALLISNLWGILK